MTDADKVRAAARVRFEKEYTKLVNKMMNEGLDKMTIDGADHPILKELFRAGGFEVTPDDYVDRLHVKVPHIPQPSQPRRSPIAIVGAEAVSAFWTNETLNSAFRGQK